MTRRGRCGGWGLVTAILLAISAPSAHAQNLSCSDPGDLEVLRLTFTGNNAFPSSVLADGIVTDESSWARRHLRYLGGFWGTKRCIDKQAFPLDRVRLIVLYHNKGYASATVDTIITAMGPGKIQVRFAIHEGEPTIVDSLAFNGLDSVPERAAILAGLSTRLGKPFDKYAIDTTVGDLTQRLHNGGYPDAEVLPQFDTRKSARRASITFDVTTGPRMKFGDISISDAPREGATRHVTDKAIRRIASLNAGELYSQAELQRAQRALYQTNAFASVKVSPDSLRPLGGTTVPVGLHLSEDFMHDAKVGVGYGTLDCFRTNANYTAYSVFGGTTRLDLRGQLSKIGVGKPLQGLESLCPIARSDLYSKDLNYLLAATATQPAIFQGIVPSYSLYSERRSEFDAYLRTTPVGGNMTFSKPTGRTVEAFSYSVEYGRTEAQPALLCAVFNACEPADRESVQRLQRLAVASFSITRNASDNPVTPTRGTVLRAEFRTAGVYTGSDPSLHFNKILVDGSLYVPIGPDVVLAARVRLGAVLGSNFGFSNSGAFIPQQERLFAGGQTTVRGFQQNELGPAVYIPLKFDTVNAVGAHVASITPGDTVFFRATSTLGGQRTIPTGGNALAVGMLEARIRSPIFPDALQWALFLDAGSVWNVGNAGQSIGAGALKLTPGFGVRVKTQIGVLRVDFAYNPYQQPSGAAYFDAPIQSGGALFCVSPKNTLGVTLPALGGVITQATGSCPASYQPPLQSTWWRRFAFVLTLGEAF